MDAGATIYHRTKNKTIVCVLSRCTRYLKKIAEADKKDDLTTAMTYVRKALCLAVYCKYTNLLVDFV